MANSDDDDPGARKPLFVPPIPAAKPGSGASLFAPPSMVGPSRPGGFAPPTVSAGPTKPVFGEWPVAEEAKPAEPEQSEPEKSEPEQAEPEQAEPAGEDVPANLSSLRAPVHARRTSTQAHAIVGEFGVPTPSDSQPRVAKPDFEDDESEAEYDPDHEQPETTSSERSPILADPRPVAQREAPAAKPSSMAVWIGLGLAATLIVAVVVGMQNRTPKDPKIDPAKPNRAAAGAPLDSKKPVTQPRPPENTRTVLSESTGPAGEAGEPEVNSETETGGTETGGTETGGPPAPSPREDVDPRDPSVIPPGTPEDTIKAFLKIPVSIHDGPPLGGIGRTGIHIDAITTGREYRSGECKDEVDTFSIATDKEVSVCFRVVHDREEESVRILWEKDGVTTRRGGVRIRDLHAYKTRAYLELRPEYIGKWRVRVVNEGDDVELASFEFEIGP